MEVTLGSEWKMLFDIVVVEAHKPLFHRAENSFYLYDSKSYEDSRGAKVASHEEINAFDHKVYVEGNARTLTKYFQTQYAK